jgi:hypothetical protein
MRSNDVTRLYGAVNVRTKVAVMNTRLDRAVAQATLQSHASGVRLAGKASLTSHSGARVVAN